MMSTLLLELVDIIARCGFSTSDRSRGFHLAIFVEPYLSRIHEMIKKIESRWSINKINPFGKVFEHDIIFTKLSSGPITGWFEAGWVQSFMLEKTPIDGIRAIYGIDLAITDEQFWIEKKAARYCTLVQVTNATRIDPVTITKKDPRGWVVLQERARVVEGTLESFIHRG